MLNHHRHHQQQKQQQQQNHHRISRVVSTEHNQRNIINAFDYGDWWWSCESHWFWWRFLDMCVCVDVQAKLSFVATVFVLSQKRHFVLFFSFLSLFDRAAELHDILNANRILRIYRTGIFKPGLSTSRLILLTWLRRIKESSFHCIYITTVSTRSSSSCVYVIATHTKFSSDAYVSMIFHFICVYSWHRFVVW